MKRFFSQSLQWLSALMLAVLICNGVLFFYNRPTAFIDRTKASTNTIFYTATTPPTATDILIPICRAQKSTLYWLEHLTLRARK